VAWVHLAVEVSQGRAHTVRTQWTCDFLRTHASSLDRSGHLVTNYLLAVGV